MIANSVEDLTNKLDEIKEKYLSLRATLGEYTKLTCKVLAPFEAIKSLGKKHKVNEETGKVELTYRTEGFDMFDLCIFLESIEVFNIELTIKK